MKPLSIHIEAHDYLVNGINWAKKFFSEFPASDFDRLVAEGVIRGGMIPKVEASREIPFHAKARSREILISALTDNTSFVISVLTFVSPSAVFPLGR
jgi:hypothetical protein